MRYSNGMSTELLKTDVSKIDDKAAQAAEKKRLGNAQRQARWRERQRAEGMQITASVPMEIAQALKDGKLVKVMTQQDLRALKIGHECLKSGGLKKLTLSKLISLDVS